MLVHCINTHCAHETQCMKNNKPCAWCNSPMRAIGDCWMSTSDDSLSTEEKQDER